MTQERGQHRLTRVTWRRRTVIVALAIAALLAWWNWLAPTQLGGPVTLAVVHGSSMEPVLHTNDLVMAYQADNYGVGDMVLFRQHGGIVAHVLQSGDPATGWRTQGINNAWVDSWTLADSHILGRAIVVSPTAGAVAVWVHEHPLGWALIIATAAAIAHSVRRPRQQVASAHHRNVTAGSSVLQAVAAIGLAVSVLCAAAVLAQANAPPRAVTLSLCAVLVAAATTAVVAQLSSPTRRNQTKH